jgi:hypothetical protein
MTQGAAALPPIVPNIYPPDPTRGALKLYVNALTEFSGQPIEYEQWVLAARATLGQTVYGALLENPPPPGDIIMETRNKELFHMLVTAFMHGSGMHLLQVTLVADDGHAAFNSIKKWYGSAATSRSIINHYRKKLEGLKLDANTTASEYVNDSQICCQKLEAKNEGYTTDKKRDKDSLIRFLTTTTMLSSRIYKAIQTWHSMTALDAFASENKTWKLMLVNP